LAAREKKKSRSASPRTFRVRKATLKDLPILVGQRRAMWKAIGIKRNQDLDEADIVYKKWAWSRMKNGTLTGWIAEDYGQVIGGGCVWLQPIQPMPRYNRMLQAYLLSMYTEPKARGQGVASAIVDAALDWARKNGFPQLRLHAAEMGRGVYTRRGFKRTWEMRRRLPRRTGTRARFV
jgi:GNAT superfamily N-acetyltransferase